MNTETKTCQNCKKDFTIEPDDFSFYEKMQVPPPTFCPHCRYMRRIIWRNVHNLFRGTNAVTGEEFFTSVPPQAGMTLYEQAYWNSDAWNPYQYGREYDVSVPFFQQLNDLFRSIPYPAKSMQRCINSDYSNMCDDMKNAYLCFNATFMEDCAYCCNGSVLKSCFDLTSCYNSEFCYDNVRVDKSYNTVGSLASESCVDVWFSKNCVGCTNCFGCVNQRNATYKIFNVQYSKEEYADTLASMKLTTWEGFSKAREEAEAFWKKFPVKYMLGFRNQDVSGEDIKDCKNVHHSYIVHKGENLKFVQDVPFGGVSNSYDYTCWGVSASQIYECMIVGEQADRLKFCYECWPGCQELEYCISMRRSKNCFGCASMKDAEYCIFNKQYTKEEYLIEVAKIKQHMMDMPYIDKRGHTYAYGEFFPIEMSIFAYNESLLQDQFPSTKADAEAQGFVWREQNRKEYVTTIEASELPESEVAGEEVTQELVQCMGCTKAYRIILDELHFLKNSRLPLPRHCFDCRFARRQKHMAPPRFENTQCMCDGKHSHNGKYINASLHESHGEQRCPTTFETAYDTEKDIIYCESCYQKEVM